MFESFTPVLANSLDDERLASDGFTPLSTPLLGTDEAEALRVGFDRYYNGDEQGWHNAFNDPSSDYRLTVREVLSDALQVALKERFIDFVPFLYTYLVKWPGSDNDEHFLYLHRDWMYIDEARGGRCMIVFLALEDITTLNGCVDVLPRGNNVDPMIRGTDMSAPWLRHEEVIRPHMRSLPLRTGEAVVWDGAIVHSSRPNLTDRPRVAVGVWLRPAKEPLVHYRRTGAKTAERHLVDPDFFYTQTPESIHGFFEGKSPDAVVDVAEADLSEAELEDKLRHLRR